MSQALTSLSARIEHGLGRFLALLLVAMVLTVSWQIVTRDLLDDPSGWTEELARYLLIWIGVFGGSYAYQRRLHLGLDLLATRLEARGASGRRTRALQRRFVDGCALAFALTILVGGGSSLVALTFELEQFSPALGLPMAVVYLSLPLSGILMSVFAVSALAGPADEAAAAKDLPGGPE